MRTRKTVGVCFSVGLSLLLLGPQGCALSSQYRSATRERDDLAATAKAQAERIDQLEATTESLESNLADAYEDMEDLRVETIDLTSQVNELKRSEAALEAGLRERSVELIRSQSDLDAAQGEVARLTTTYDELMGELESEVSSGRIQIEQLREGIRVAVSDDVLFASGSARLDPLGQEVIQKVSEQLLPLDHMIEVQGHTDDRPISPRLASQFPSNWDLAAARAAAVVLQMERNGVQGDRLSMTSFSSHRPISANDSPAGRSQNRRIEIRLRPRQGDTVSEVEVVPKVNSPEH